MEPWLDAQGHGNPSSAHPLGARAAEAVAQARSHVANLIGAAPHEIVFTGCGTEADNMALLGVGPFLGHGKARAVLSAVEHPAVVEAAGHLSRDRGWSVATLAVNPDAQVDLARAEATIAAEPVTLLSVMRAQNEVGVLQPVGELSAMVRSHWPEAVVHSDAAQAVGKVPVDVDALGVDLLTVVGHKMGAPKGVGALYVRSGVSLRPLLWGGGQERGRRGGTENVAGIVALGEAARVVASRLEEETQMVRALRDALWDGLTGVIPGIVRTAGDAPQLPNTLHVCVPARDGRSLLAACPRLCASTGSACHAGDAAPSGVLGAMGLAVDVARGALRLSLGWGSTREEVDACVAALGDAAAQRL